MSKYLNKEEKIRLNERYKVFLWLSESCALTDDFIADTLLYVYEKNIEFYKRNKDKCEKQKKN